MKKNTLSTCIQIHPKVYETFDTIFSLILYYTFEIEPVIPVSKALLFKINSKYITNYICF